MLLLAVAGSMIMISVWAIRYRRGESVLPKALRQPLYVPPAVAIFGSLVALWMALSVLMVSAEMVVDATAGPDGQSDSAEISDGSPEEVPESEATSSADEADANETADNATDVADDAEVGTTSSATGAATSEADFQKLVIGTLTINGLIFVVFGSVIWLSQLNADRSVAVDGSIAEPMVSASTADEASEVDVVAAANSRWPSLNEAAAPPPEPNTAESGSSADHPSNAEQPVSDDPYRVLAEGSSNVATDANQSAEEASADRHFESWKFSTEFRYAFETFLAAYLPTAVARILIVSYQPDLPSHPLLELINEGVSVGTLFLIGLMAIVVAPLVEELLYRVTVLGGCVHLRSPMFGLVLSTLLFSFAHGFPDSIALLPLAAILGYTYLQRRSYRTVVLVHLIFNGFNMTLAALEMWQ